MLRKTTRLATSFSGWENKKPVELWNALMSHVDETLKHFPERTQQRTSNSRKYRRMRNAMEQSDIVKVNGNSFETRWEGENGLVGRRWKHGNWVINDCWWGNIFPIHKIFMHLKQREERNWIESMDYSRRARLVNVAMNFPFSSSAKLNFCVLLLLSSTSSKSWLHTFACIRGGTRCLSIERLFLWITEWHKFVRILQLSLIIWKSRWEWWSLLEAHKFYDCQVKFVLGKVGDWVTRMSQRVHIKNE